MTARRRGGARADIQGLRAVAVLLVIANHLLGAPSGGYTGVDVFFVISGFLITGLLIREHDRFGRISFRRFYARRVKRIAPAAVCVLALTVATAYALFPLPRAKSVLLDAGWASAFAENWRLITLGTDYMHANDALSPLQHFWSLSVEEQFYLVWPAVLVATLMAARSRKALVVVLGVVTVSSFVWSLWNSVMNPTAAYFSTFDRTWELGVGALLAFAAPHLPRLSARSCIWLTSIGCVLIATGAVTLTGSSRFPAPWALLPVVGAALVIAGGTGNPGRSFPPLTNRAVVYIGTISYSLYLWHLPVIVFVATLLPQRGKKYLVFALALTVVLSLISYHWLEEPLRSANWRRGLRAALVRPASRRSAQLGALLALAAVLAISLVSARVPAAAVVRSPTAAVFAHAPRTGPAEAGRGALVTESLAATAWPALSPAISALGAKAQAPEWVDDGCLGLESNVALSPEKNALRCVYGNPQGKRTLALLGDSTAISYLPGLRAAAGPDWRIEVYTMSQCPAADVGVWIGRDEAFPECDRFHRWALKHLAAERPDLVVTSSTPWSVSRLASHSADAQAVAEWKAGQEATFHALAGIRVVDLDPPPLVQGLADCAIRGSVPRDCVGSLAQFEINVSVASREAAEASRSAVYRPTLGWFCSANNSCPSFVGSTPQMADNTHLTAKASRELAPVLREVLDL